MFAHEVEQGGGRRLGLGLELGPQDRPAELVLTKRLRPLTQADVAPDGQPMRVFATRIVGQEVERPLQGRPVVALGEVQSARAAWIVR